MLLRTDSRSFIPQPLPQAEAEPELALPRHYRLPIHRGLGLIELLALVAVLMIALALMVATARHVRSTSANELTRKRMFALAEAATAAIERGVDPTLPMTNPTAPSTNPAAATGTPPTGTPPTSAPPTGTPEDRLLAFARASSRKLDEALAVNTVERPALANAIVAAAAGRPELDDAWGQPIALIPGQQPSLGMAPDDGPFLVSAGPDGRFLTISDNIYSYDLPVLVPKPKGSEERGQGSGNASKLSAPDP